MTIQTLKVGNQKLVVLSEKDYKALVRRAGHRTKATKARGTRKRRATQDPSAWLNANWNDVTAKAKANTRALTGKDHL